MLNNSGGRIFQRLFESPLFLNEHHLNFEPIAKQWGLPYVSATELPQTLPSQRSFLLEAQPDLSQTEAVWSALNAVVQSDD